MKQQILVYATIVCATILFCGCRRDKNDDPIVYPTYDLGELKQYAYFKVGTYWVYSDSVRGIKDSVYVYYNYEGRDTSFNNDGSINSVFQYFESRSHSGQDGFNYYEWYNSSWTTNNPLRQKIFYDKTQPGNYVGETILLDFPPRVGSNVYIYNDIITTQDFLSNYLLDSANFNSVIKIHHTMDITKSNQHTNYFIAKGRGIIRKELLDSNQVWNLIRYNIVQ